MKDAKLPNKTMSPWSSNYRPEIGMTPELEPAEVAYYQLIIGVLQWIIELGQGDICM